MSCGLHEKMALVGTKTPHQLGCAAGSCEFPGLLKNKVSR